MMFSFTNIVACIISIVAVTQFLCCSLRGPQPAKYAGILLAIGLALSFIACFLLLFPGKPCQEVTSYCINSCTQCGSGSFNCNDGVSNGAWCRRDSYTNTTDCAKKWCAYMDGDCDKAQDDDNWYWGFSSEDSCLEDYGDLTDYMAVVCGLGLFAGIVNVILRCGAVACAFRCPGEELPVPDVQIMQGQTVAMPVVQGEVVQQSQLALASEDVVLSSDGVPQMVPQKSDC